MHRVIRLAALRQIILCFLLMSGAPAADAPAVAFATFGGDAWTFDKAVEVSASAADCDVVAIISPFGSILARPSNNHVVTRVWLRPGDNTIKAECRKNGLRSGAIAEQHWFVRLRNAPRASARAIAADGQIRLSASASRGAPADSVPITRYAWRLRHGSAGPWAGLPADGVDVTLAPPPRDGDYFVTLQVTDALGRVDEVTASVRVRAGEAQAIDPLREHAGWIDDAVIYGIEPLRFGAHGLRDILPRLDALRELGISTLWLLPITDAPDRDFGYAVTDHFRIRPELGDEEDLQNLVRAAHARGLRVILDFVPNHLSEQSAYFIDAQAHGRRSPYFDYFARDAGGHAVHYFDWHNLENLNYDNPEVQHLVIEASAYWVRKFDIDGFRVDAAWGPRERAPAFWPRWQAELKRIKPDLLLLAEASARDPYYSGSGFDAAYDWSDQLGEWAWRDAFETGSLERLRSAIGERSSRAPLVFRFLDNNDTGARFVTRYGVARTRVAAAMLLTLPGLPGLYSGEEVGAAFEPYADGGTIAGEDSYGLRAWYAHLLALRRTYPALRSRELHMLNVVPSNQVLAYLRPGETERDDLIVLLNYGPAPLRISLPDEVIRGAPLEGWKDLVNGECLRLQDGSLLLPPQSVRILKRG